MNAASPQLEDSPLPDADPETLEPGSSSNSPAEFFRGLLAQALAATGGEAAAAWGLTPQGVLALAGSIRFQETGLAQNAPAARQHVQLLLEVLHSGQARIYHHRAKAAATESSEGHVILLAPILQRQNTVGVLEAFLPPETSDDDAAGRLAVLSDLSRLATEYLDGRAAGHDDRPGDGFSRRLVTYLERLHRDLCVGSVAMTAANEGRRLFGCDRASIAMMRGKKTEIVAISGQDRVRRKSNLVRAMTDLASVVATTGRPLYETDELNSLPPQVREPLTQYLAEGGATRFAALPLLEPQRATVDDEVKAAQPAEAIGVMLLEWFAADASSESNTTTAESGAGPSGQTSAANQELVAAHTAQALHNALVHEGEFLSPLWRSVSKRLTAAERATRKRRAVFLLCGLVGLFLLMLLPVPYYVPATGELLPVVHLGVFAPEDGRVDKVLVRGGDHVDKGQVLLRLRNDALTAERLQADNRVAELEKSLSALVAQRSTAGDARSREASIRLEGRIAQTQIELDGIRERLVHFERELARLEVRAVVAGTVATFQPTQHLLNRPVRRGELLLEVINESGPWQLELEIPAERLGHVLRAQADQDQPRLPARYTLATSPEKSFDGVVQQWATRIDTAQDGTSVLLARAAVRVDDIPNRTSGSEVMARIYCGRRSLAYWLFGDVVEFVRRHVW